MKPSVVDADFHDVDEYLGWSMLMIDEFFPILPVLEALSMLFDW